MDEIVERDQGLLEAFLVDLEAVSRHFVVTYPDDATGVAGAGSLLVPSPGDFPSLACLCERWARIGNFPSLAQDGQGIKDIEEDALGEFDVMVPSISDLAEAVSLGDNVEEDEERLLDADFGRDLGGDVCEDPVGEFEKRLLVHVGEADEALGDREHERHGSACTGGLYTVHCFRRGCAGHAGRLVW